MQGIDSTGHETLQFRFTMRPRSQADGNRLRLFQAHFDQILNPDHPLVVLARKKDGKIEGWNRLDEVWGLVGDKPVFAEYLRHEIDKMLDASGQDPLGTQPAMDQALPVPGSETDDLPVPTGPAEIPIPD